jgi:hypothetical protein
MPLSKSERSIFGRIGGLSTVALAPSASAVSAPARKAFLQKFYDATDPSLPPEERERQAAAARKAHMTRLSYLAVKKRRIAAEARKAANAAVDELAAELAADADPV